jgi:hypothetical protein
VTAPPAQDESDGALEHKTLRDGDVARSNWMPWAIIAVGWALRLRLYFAARSMRHDEASLVLNIIGRSYSGLLGPLDREQGAPLGFLWLEKLVIAWLGDGELALRLVPLLAGLIALPLLYGVAKRMLRPTAICFALAIMAVGEPLIQYCAEVKQYSLDVACTLALAAIALRVRVGSRVWLWLLGIAGCLAIWFSHPAVFVLGGIGATFFVFDMRERRWARVAVDLLLGAIWGLSFYANDRLFLRYLRANGQLLNFWSGAFAPFPPRGPADLRWYLETIFNIFKDPSGLPATGLALLAGIVGAYELGRRNAKGLGMLIAPVLLTLVASALGKYPFAGRLILFIVPVFCLLIGEGLAVVASFADRRANWLAIAWVALLLATPGFNALRTLLRPPEGEELRPVLAAIEDRWQAGDRIYVYHGAEAAFSYYVGRKERPFQFATVPILGASGRDDWSVYPREVARIKGSGRVWVVFSHIVKISGVDEEQFLLFFLDRAGRQLRRIPGFGASAYLYDLSPATASREPSELPEPPAIARSARVDRTKSARVH